MILPLAGLLAFSVAAASAETRSAGSSERQSAQTSEGGHETMARSSSMHPDELTRSIARHIRQEVRRAVRGEMRRHGMGQEGERRAGPAAGPRAMDGAMSDMLASRAARLRGIALQTVFVLLDADGDGSVSLEEAQSFTERMFNLLDADGDGELTIEEIETFLRGAPR